jgi:hypothetical protein
MKSILWRGTVQVNELPENRVSDILHLRPGTLNNLHFPQTVLEIFLLFRSKDLVMPLYPNRKHNGPGQQCPHLQYLSSHKAPETRQDGLSGPLFFGLGYKDITMFPRGRPGQIQSEGG